MLAHPLSAEVCESAPYHITTVTVLTNYFVLSHSILCFLNKIVCVSYIHTRRYSLYLQKQVIDKGFLLNVNIFAILK